MIADRRKLSASALALVLTFAACVSQPALLNSERIEQRFGSYGVEVLEQSPNLRRSNLYSVEKDGHVCRTYAVVQFHENPADIQSIHQAVLDGQSIGASFKAAGWSVAKRTIYIGSVFVDADDGGILRLMHLAQPQELAMHVYELDLHRGGCEIHYATIIEVHHPDYLDVDALRRIYREPSAGEADPARVARYEAVVHSE